MSIKKLLKVSAITLPLSISVLADDGNFVPKRFIHVDGQVYVNANIIRQSELDRIQDVYGQISERPADSSTGVQDIWEAQVPMRAMLIDSQIEGIDEHEFIDIEGKERELQRVSATRTTR